MMAIDVKIENDRFRRRQRIKILTINTIVT